MKRPTNTRKKRKLNTGDATGHREDDEDGEGEDDEDESEDEEEVPERMQMPQQQQAGKAKSVTPAAPTPPPQAAPGQERNQDPIWGAEESQTQDVDMDMDAPEPGGIREDRYVSSFVTLIAAADCNSFEIGTDSSAHGYRPSGRRPTRTKSRYRSLMSCRQ